MILDSIILVAGLVLLIFGGDGLVRGASSLARHFGLSTLVIGLTVVAFGTSAPELAVNLQAALLGSGGVSFGNIIGSNIANIGLILGISAVVMPLVIQPTIVRREVPMMLLATAAVLAMALDQWLGIPAQTPDGAPGTFDLPGLLSRGDGLILLMLFGVFIYYTVSDVLLKRQSDAYLLELTEEEAGETPMRLPWAVVVLIAGLVGVVGGGRLTVDGAVGLAEALGVSQAVVGLTVVALGTSLPELATCLMALRRGHTDLAVGNVVGSNIFNLLLVLALTALTQPLEVPTGGLSDLAVMAALSLVLLPFAASGHNRLSRVEGVLLLAAYVGYLTWRAMSELRGGG